MTYTGTFDGALFFKSNDTGSNVGKAPYLILNNTSISIFEFRGRNDCSIRFSIPANDVTITQGNFNERSDSASGNTVGYIVNNGGEKFCFIPREGFSYFVTSTNRIDVYLVGERPVVGG